jgi:membrane dipeptidase
MSTEETHQKSRSEAEHPPKVEYVRGLENPTEASWNVIRWMVSKGYSDEKIAKVIGGNVIRVLKDALIPG